MIVIIHNYRRPRRQKFYAGYLVAEWDMVRTDAGLETAGKVDVTWQDFGVEPPNMGFGSVVGAGSIEFFRKITK
mgnify:CR=1 FL=1